jgi:hypothetical protein
MGPAATHAARQPGGLANLRRLFRSRLAGFVARLDAIRIGRRVEEPANEAIDAVEE